jgi:hypothetical protein
MLGCYEQARAEPRIREALLVNLVKCFPDVIRRLAAYRKM